MKTYLKIKDLAQGDTITTSFLVEGRRIVLKNIVVNNIYGDDYSIQTETGSYYASGNIIHGEKNIRHAYIEREDRIFSTSMILTEKVYDKFIKG